MVCSQTSAGHLSRKELWNMTIMFVVAANTVDGVTFKKGRWRKSLFLCHFKKKIKIIDLPKIISHALLQVLTVFNPESHRSLLPKQQNKFFECKFFSPLYFQIFIRLTVTFRFQKCLDFRLKFFLPFMSQILHTYVYTREVEMNDCH